MNRKGLAAGLILLLIGISVIPITAQNIEKSSQPSLRGNWWYVGGSGPGNYTKIQDAINHASWGDTVFVYSGVYYEKINIDRALCLLGESRDTTIIANISNYGSLIDLSCSNITISGFTLNLSGACIISCSSGHYYRDILISNNIFQTNISFCILLTGCDFCTITQNIFYVNFSNVIYLSDSENCFIANNLIICSEGGGIFLDESSYNKISNNSLESETPFGLGIALRLSDFNTISNNTLYNYTWAIY
ncbi:MAG: right-handed parallel beta-helix repeat-containing protein, partial [Euryarchaeota archaeon]|nr:right-handed parallel beta-helix repeat-containing protein [Euryarchaeota archaeon]